MGGGELKATAPPPPLSNPPAAKFASQRDAHMRTDGQIKFLYYPLLTSNSIYTFTELLPNNSRHFFESLNGHLNRQKILKQKFPRLKLVSANFYQIFIFSSNGNLLKTMKNVFYFIEKALFVLEIFKFL